MSNRPEIEETSRQNDMALRQHIEKLPALRVESLRLEAERDRAMDRVARTPTQACADAVREYEAAKAARAAQLARFAPPRPRLPPPPVNHSVHHLVPALGFALLPAVWLVLQARRRRRLVKRLTFGLCPACGYDCRTTPGHCPECGTKTSPSSVTLP